MIIQNEAMLTKAVRAEMAATPNPRRRCSVRHSGQHVHFRVSSPGFKTLVTQVFVDDTQHLENDVTFSVTPSLIGLLKDHDTFDGAPEGFTAPWCSLVYDLSLARRKPSPTPPIR